jgi:hypothetical protein
VAPCHGHSRDGAQSFLFFKQLQQKIHGAFDGYFMAVFFRPVIDVSQFRGEKVNAVFVATFGLALSVAMRATGSLTAITNKLAASFEPGRKFFI